MKASQSDNRFWKCVNRALNHPDSVLGEPSALLLRDYLLGTSLVASKEQPGLCFDIIFKRHVSVEINLELEGDPYIALENQCDSKITAWNLCKAILKNIETNEDSVYALSFDKEEPFTRDELIELLSSVLARPTMYLHSAQVQSFGSFWRGAENFMSSYLLSPGQKLSSEFRKWIEQEYRLKSREELLFDRLLLGMQGWDEINSWRLCVRAFTQFKMDFTSQL